VNEQHFNNVLHPYPCLLSRCSLAALLEAGVVYRSAATLARFGDAERADEGPLKTAAIKQPHLRTSQFLARWLSVLQYSDFPTGDAAMTKNSRRVLLAMPPLALLMTTVPVLSARDHHTIPIVAAANSCDINAYAQNEVRALNVRSGPGTKYGIVRTLIVPSESSCMVFVDGGTGPWLRISGAYIDDDIDNPDVKVRGWVYAPLLATATQGSSKTKVRLWRAPSHKSAIVAKLPGEEQTTVTGCQGDWVQVQHSIAAGWLDAESQCGNPFTTCA
jgi:SH3-like domain-containing protein